MVEDGLMKPTTKRVTRTFKAFVLTEKGKVEMERSRAERIARFEAERPEAAARRRQFEAEVEAAHRNQ